ncbi:MAG: DNA adenine methylase [Chromatiaceae bacterium]|nr:DNA adenine methylase [Chromatiaceae bacterium]
MIAPFPYFGGKSKVADPVWRAFGTVSNYVEPFFGSGAVLLARPMPINGPETINDFDGMVANFWRALQADPEAVADWADWPVNECDLHARHLWLVNRRPALTAALMADPAWYDAQTAGWWVWGLCSWIGSGWCSGQGPWQARDGKLVDTRQRPHLGNAGMGINRQLPHLGDAGMGINRKLPHLGDAGMGINRKRQHLRATFSALADRLRAVRVCCGDWSRVTGDSVTVKHPGITGVFLDPPYADTAGRDSDLYACDDEQVAHRVREWAIAHGDDPRLRIALCGYAGEHVMPDTWTAHAWKTQGGYGAQGDGVGRINAAREVIWLSPHCLTARRQADLFAAA